MYNCNLQKSRELIAHLTDIGILKPVEGYKKMLKTYKYDYLEKGFYVDPRDANGKVPF